MDTVVQFRHVCKRYGKQVALDDVSFDIPPGVVFALLGENGAGKTTAIRILLGLTEADSGNASALGLDSPKQALAIRRRVGYVPEQPVLYDWMTVDEIGWFAAGFHRPSYFDRYRSLVREFDLPGTQKLGQLSKGYRAKVVLSLAMAGDPELLILDEPTSGLDPLVRRAFLQSMVDRAATGQTVLLSSHQIAEVERVADWVGILHCGRLRLVSRLDALKASVREITLTFDHEIVAPPQVPAEIIHARKHGRQWQLWVTGFQAEDQPVLAAQSGVLGIEVRQSSLEEIFLAYVQQDSSAAVNDDAEQETVS